MGGAHRNVLHKLLKNNPHEKIAEIGVFEGRLTNYLLSNLPNIKTLYAVDLWEHYPEFDEILDPKRRMLKADMNVVFNKFKEAIRSYENKVSILRMYSKDAAKEIPDESLDLVFIDANHAYKYVREDILLWTPKVKVGGIVSGHDYGIEHRKPKFGVTQAVNELIPDPKIKASVWYDIKKEGNWLKE